MNILCFRDFEEEFAQARHQTNRNRHLLYYCNIHRAIVCQFCYFARSGSVVLVHPPNNCMSVLSLCGIQRCSLLHLPSNCLSVLSLSGFQRCSLFTSTEQLSVSFVIEWVPAV